MKEIRSEDSIPTAFPFFYPYLHPANAPRRQSAPCIGTLANLPALAPLRSNSHSPAPPPRPPAVFALSGPSPRSGIRPTHLCLPAIFSSRPLCLFCSDRHPLSFHRLPYSSPPQPFHRFNRYDPSFGSATMRTTHRTDKKTTI